MHTYSRCAETQQSRGRTRDESPPGCELQTGTRCAPTRLKPRGPRETNRRCELFLLPTAQEMLFLNLAHGFLSVFSTWAVRTQWEETGRRNKGLGIRNRGCRIPWWLGGEESASQCRRHGFDPWSGRIRMPRSKWARAPSLLSLCPRTQELHLSPHALEPRLHKTRSQHSEKPPHSN